MIFSTPENTVTVVEKILEMVEEKKIKKPCKGHTNKCTRTHKHTHIHTITAPHECLSMKCSIYTMKTFQTITLTLNILNITAHFFAL